MKVVLPKSLEPRDLPELLSKTEYIFEKITYEPDFRLDLSSIAKTHFLGMLVISKLVEFGYLSKRFRNPELEWDKFNFVKKEMIRYGFWNLIQNFFSKRVMVDEEYKKLQTIFENNYFLAPQPLLRRDDYTANKLRQDVLPSIEKYYSNPKAIDMIFHCISEIVTNFWEHAVDDTRSIIVARGSSDTVEIACADTAEGIISTLRPLFEGLTNTEILEKSLEKGVTSKKNTDHMGHGLWFLSRITSMVQGRMHVYSEGYMHRNDFGNVRVSKCGYWKGTIIYLSLSVTKPITISDIPEFKNTDKFKRLKIDFI